MSEHSTHFSQSPRFQRAGEIIIPLLSWLIITLPLWLSPFHPALVAYFIISFDLYFLYQSLKTTYYASLTYRTLQVLKDVPFAEKVKEETMSKEVNHFIVIPNYKEPIYKLESAIRSIAESDYPYKNIYLVLAFEKREEEAKEKAAHLRGKFGHFFKEILETYHVLQGNEVSGKASNQSYACRQVEAFCDKKKYDLQKTIITISDADSHFASNFFSYLTYEFVIDTERLYHFYWAPVLLYNNFWQLPFFVRMQATLSSIVRLAFLSQKDQLIQLSTYATNLWLLKQVDYWDVDIIPEDWHIHFQAFFKFGDKVKTIPLYTLVNGDAVYSGSLWKTLTNRYEQEKRWAWGVTDVAYAWNNIFTTPHISASTKFKKLYTLVKTHLFWPTSFFILTVSASIPPLVNPVFKRTVLGFLLPQLSGVILTSSTLMLILYVYLDVKMRQRLKVETKMIYLPLLLVQWYLLPLVSFLLSSLPALDAHTRLLLGKKITYKVTEKV